MSRKNRRVTRPAPEGVDPNPKLPALDEQAASSEAQSWGDEKETNDERLLRDRPPHWASKEET